MNLFKKIRKIAVVAVVSLATVCSCVGVTASADSTADALRAFQQSVDKGVTAENTDGIQNEAFILEGGGTVTYKDLVDETGKPTTTFTKLTSKEQERALTAMLAAADYAVEVGTSGITEDTKQTWLQSIQNSDGVGSRLIASLLADTKPDFASASSIFQPFSGVIGTAMGLGSILIMAFLGLTMVLDLAYIGLPMFRLMVGGGGDKGESKPKFISHEAVSSVKIAEDGQGGDGKTEKIAVAVYFKKRVLMLTILGICLLYLISGRIWTLVSWILDLLAGFI